MAGRFAVILEDTPTPGLIVRRNLTGDGWNETNPPEPSSDIFDIDDGVLVFGETPDESIIDIDENALQSELDEVEATLQDEIDAISASDCAYDAENKQGTTISAGMAVATHSSGTGIVLASAANNTKPCVGLVRADTLNAVSGTVQTDAILTMADWTDVTGSATLTRGTYYLSPTTPGMLTQIAPSVVGEVIQVVGYAISPTELDLSPNQYLQL